MVDKKGVVSGDGSGLLTSLNNYLAAGIHIGVKYKTRFMSPFIYKVRSDGLAVMNIEEIDNRIRLASALLALYDPKDVLVVGRREAAKKPLNVFALLTGCRVISGRYFPGTLTNPSFPGYSEVKIVLTVDPWKDRNVISDALKTNVVVISLANTNNTTQNVDLLVPCNNKSKKSLALVFYLLAREYCRIRGLEFKASVNDFLEKSKKKSKITVK